MWLPILKIEIRQFTVGMHLEKRHTFTPRAENTGNKRRKSEKPLKGELLRTVP